MKLYLVGFMMENYKTGYQKVFATSAQEAAGKIRERKDVLDVFSVYLPLTDWK